MAAKPPQRGVGKTGAAAGGKPKIGVKKPSGKTQPLMKGTTGTRKTAVKKATAPVAKKVNPGAKGKPY